MSARLARAEVLAALRDAPASGATVGDLCGAVGLSPPTIARAVARLVAEGEVEVVGVGVRIKPPPAPPAPSAPTAASETQREPARDDGAALDALRERLLSVRATREDRVTITRLLSRLRAPATQAEALALLWRLEAR